MPLKSDLHLISLSAVRVVMVECELFYSGKQNRAGARGRSLSLGDVFSVAAALRHRRAGSCVEASDSGRGEFHSVTGGIS